MSRLIVPKDDRGRFPAKHSKGVDPALVGVSAFDHPAVREYHEWLRTRYQPRYSVMLVTPCSNVKPYTKSPTSAKVRGVLKRLGLWDASAGVPRGVEWAYLSDLLVLVPYERAEEYPACCYELHPEELKRSPGHFAIVVNILASVMERLSSSIRVVITFLPSLHLEIWNAAKRRAWGWPREHRVKYTIFSTKELETVLRQYIGGSGSHTRTLDAWLL